MSNLYNPITACLKKHAGREEAVEQKAKDDEKKPSTGIASNAAPSGWVQGIASGVYNVGAGGAKWVASTTYNVGATVLGTGASVLGTGTNLARKVVARKDKSKDE
ncbi:uncharacterized protein LOC119170602 [Rhipicephalus microplus]|uniref:uncharacterized protein LOC119170602 n=1 Tax=Rhipicephalus microplus TaxID=6941 RepID=UPI003F6B1F56